MWEIAAIEEVLERLAGSLRWSNAWLSRSKRASMASDAQTNQLMMVGMSMLIGSLAPKGTITHE